MISTVMKGRPHEERFVEYLGVRITGRCRQLLTGLQAGVIDFADHGE